MKKIICTILTIIILTMSGVVAVNAYDNLGIGYSYSCKKTEVPSYYREEGFTAIAIQFSDFYSLNTAPNNRFIINITCENENAIDNTCPNPVIYNYSDYSGRGYYISGKTIKDGKINLELSNNFEGRQSLVDYFTLIFYVKSVGNNPKIEVEHYNTAMDCIEILSIPVQGTLVKGDVDLDGRVTSRDYLLLKKYFAGENEIGIGEMI